jgi:uncharacterized membrane protein
MNRDDEFGIPSTAKIAEHPIHPMLVPFPIAFLIGALLSDLAFWGSSDQFWARASAWLIGAGLVGAALAALAGLTDFVAEPRIRLLREAWIHLGGNVLAVLVALGNLILRLANGSAASILPTGLVLSIVVVAIFALTGWMGWQMVYRHGVGLAAAGAAEHSPAESAPMTKHPGHAPR